MTLGSLTPTERLTHIVSAISSGEPLESFCVLATSLRPVPDAEASPAVAEQLIQSFLGPVIVLEAMAQAFATVLKVSGPVYLLGDDIFTSVADRATLVTRQPWELHLEILALVGVIFRFPVARKFGYIDRSINQLRSNSWGSSVIDQASEVYVRTWDHTSTFFKDVLTDHRSEYLELLDCCQSPRKPLDIDRIHALNELLPVPIVT